MFNFISSNSNCLMQNNIFYRDRLSRSINFRLLIISLSSCKLLSQNVLKVVSAFRKLALHHLHHYNYNFKPFYYALIFITMQNSRKCENRLVNDYAPSSKLTQRDNRTTKAPQDIHYLEIYPMFAV